MTEIERRLSTIIPGDPVGDYFGFPETQLQIIESERNARTLTCAPSCKVVPILDEQPTNTLAVGDRS